MQWMAFDTVDPIGGKRADWNAANISSILMNVAAGRNGSRKRFKPADLLLEYGKDYVPAKEGEVSVAPAKTWQEMKMIGMMWAAASNSPKKWKK
jgi:hypothetical protein